MKKLLVTGSSGLVGSEAVRFFDALGWEVTGLDNNLRRSFFGPDGDTSWNLKRLKADTRTFTSHSVDIRHRERLFEIVRDLEPTAIVHCAAQPSHDLAKERPFDDFEVNAVGTLNLLEAARQHSPEAPFVFLSTNKVYGDAPNEVPLVERATRFDFADPMYLGIDETCRVDATLHSLFGTSKLSADLLVQEYGRYFGMPTVCFRGGCLTGPHHSGAELHGFLAYVAKAISEGRIYRIFGYQGKQVRDNLHSLDVCRAIAAHVENPGVGTVFNLGGGRANSISVLEAISAFEERLGKKAVVEYIEEARVGDHICYITDLSRIRRAFPEWSVSIDLQEILDQLAKAARL